jgi:hypothetical protein
MPFKSLMGFMQWRLARAGLGLLVLAAAVLVQYKLANIPQPVNLDTTEKFSPAKVRLGQEKLIIEGPVVNSSEGVLFSHNGKPNEIVNATFDRARLDEETIEIFRESGLSPPSITARIDYRAENPTTAPVGDESCRTQVELRATPKMPDEIHLFQLDAPGLNNYRQLEMTIRGAELTSQLVTGSPSGSYLEPGCQKELKVGDWNKSIANDVTTIAAENSALRFRFLPLKTDSPLWGDAEGFFEPFDLGAPQIESTAPSSFQARAVSISPLGDGNKLSSKPALLSAQSVDGGPLLTISGLKIGSDQLLISVAGKGWVQIDGEDATVNLLNRIEENPIPAAILGAANAALLAWVARLVFKQPSPSPQPKSTKGRSRKNPRRRKSSAKK